jgi:two-component system cell cycle sensor histidine kinase/response regulator CckA
VGVNRRNDPVIGATIVNFRDITDRKRLEQQLCDAHKMEAVARLVGGVAHDFNNLLTAIMLYSDLLLETLAPGGNPRRYADEVRMAAARGSALVRQLLAFARQQALDPKVLSLNSVIESMRELLDRLLGENVRFITDLADGLANTRVDPVQMQQVVMNLVLNAREAMADGGELIIRTYNLDESDAGARGGLTSGKHVALSVTDNGCGMDAYTRTHLFEPFFTTKEQGTGLGLPTVYAIVSQSGGTISVESEVGQGTTITIRLPRVDAVGEELRAQRLPAAIAHGTETVLLVEDENIVRESVTQLLSDCGYRVLAARDGREALVLARAEQGAIDLLITDLVMPGMSGREVARRVVPLQPGIRVLFMSGYDQGNNRTPDPAVFPKPFTRAALVQKVREVLDGTAPPVTHHSETLVVPSS